MARPKNHKQRKNKSLNTGMDFSSLDNIRGISEGQKVFLTNMHEKARRNENTLNGDFNQDDVLIGCPGTGKTFLALTRALKILSERDNVNKITVVRSAEAGQDVGFLPGDLGEKTEPFESGVRNLVNDIMGRGEAYDTLKKKDVIEFILPTHLRSTTMDGQVIIVDEIQNLDEDLLETIFTRGGEESYVILCGDYIQSDIKKESKKGDVIKFLRTLNKMDNYRPDFYIFGIDDIIRHERIKDYIRKKYGEEYSKVYDEFRDKATYGG
jgi:phosphate starvation-inducible PhoH-like protein